MCSSHPLLNSREVYTKKALYLLYLLRYRFFISVLHQQLGDSVNRNSLYVFFPFRYLSYLEHNTDYCLITLAISRRPLAAGSWVWKYADLSGVCGEQCDSETSILQVLQFSTDSVVPHFSLIFFDLSRTLGNWSNWQRHVVTQLKIAQKFILILFFTLRMRLVKLDKQFTATSYKANKIRYSTWQFKIRGLEL